MKSFRIFLLVIGFVVLFSVVIVLIVIATSFKDDKGEQDTITLDELIESDRSNCSVIGIDVYGSLLTYIPQQNEYSPSYNPDLISSKYVTYYIEKANAASDIEAIILDVDSSGGVAVAGEEVANAINASTKPVIAVVRQRGMSAAYWAVSSADRIFASKNSEVGSIGVTSSYLDNVQKNEKEGYQFISLTAGEYKDAGNPNRALTNEEREVWLRDINIIHQNFIMDVSSNRQIPLEAVQKIADGSSVMGQQALQLKLIDEIGGLSEAQAYVNEIIGEESKICWY